MRDQVRVRMIPSSLHSPIVFFMIHTCAHLLACQHVCTQCSSAERTTQKCCSLSHGSWDNESFSLLFLWNVKRRNASLISISQENAIPALRQLNEWCCYECWWTEKTLLSLFPGIASGVVTRAWGVRSPACVCKECRTMQLLLLSLSAHCLQSVKARHSNDVAQQNY